MRYYYFIKKILTKNEIFKMYFVCFLMVVNSILEVISIGALLPLLSIMMDNKLNIPFMNHIYILFDNFNISLDIYPKKSSCLLIRVGAIYQTFELKMLKKCFFKGL